MGDDIVSSIPYVRLYADSAGQSHVEKGATIELTSRDFVPPAAPIDISPIEPASSYGFFRLPSGWEGD
jgi:hypothetical protein